MELFTHAAAGALLGEAFFRNRLGRAAPILGAVAAVVPDVDVVAGLASGDPQANLSAHRGATHSLLFVPLGAILVAVVATLVTRRRVAVAWGFLVALVAGASHLVLDLATSYGTMILWPWDHTRWALDWLCFIDPYLLAILTVTLILVWRRQRRDARADGSAGEVHPGMPWRGIALRGLFMALLYVLALGAGQRAAMDRLAEQLNRIGYTSDTVDRLSCTPVPFVPLAWNAFFTTDGGRRVHVGLIWILREGTTQFDVVVGTPSTPAVEAFRDSDAGRAWLRFARFPVLTTEPGLDGVTNLTGRDERFQTWIPRLGWRRFPVAVIHADVTPDGTVKNVWME
jgi:inner membrane protein